MVILRIDFNKHDPEEIESITDITAEKTKEDVLVLPSDIDIIRDLSVEQLIKIKEFIEDVILEKELKHNDNWIFKDC